MKLELIEVKFVGHIGLLCRQCNFARIENQGRGLWWNFRAYWCGGTVQLFLANLMTITLIYLMHRWYSVTRGGEEYFASGGQHSGYYGTLRTRMIVFWRKQNEGNPDGYQLIQKEDVHTEETSNSLANISSDHMPWLLACWSAPWGRDVRQ